jgi:hypothetical protein
MILCSSYDGVPLKLKKKKQAGLQCTSMDYLSFVLTPLRIFWTIPLSQNTWLIHIHGAPAAKN